MKILKNSLIILLFTIFGCNNDHNNFDVISEEENISINQTKSVSAYSLQEILNGIRKWDTLRGNPDKLIQYFESFNTLNLDMSQFPQGSALHAYACILNGELKFAVISEAYDKENYEDSLINHIKIVDLHYIDISTLTEKSYQNYTFPLPTQYIQATDAITRIEDWKTSYSLWLKNYVPIYQCFNIPTYSLQAQNYTVYFGLKKNVENPIVKNADLVLNNNNGLFYDAVGAYPPLVHQTKYYILELI